MTKKGTGDGDLRIDELKIAKLVSQEVAGLIKEEKGLKEPEDKETNKTYPCPECGAPLFEGAKYCPNCGVEIDWVE